VWHAGDIVLKRLDMSHEELEWHAEVLASVRSERVRVAPPLRAANGELVVDGWRAYRYLQGQHEPRRWPEIIAVGEELHAGLAHAPRAAFFDERTHGWAVGDRVAWGEIAPREAVDRWPQTRPLLEVLRPVEAASQAIHGDLTGNVLFAPGLPPAIIDFSPYWRPPAFATAIVVADALLGGGADESLLDATSHIEDFGQYFARALIFRFISDMHLSHRPGLWQRYQPAIELAWRLAG
jgi:uncharacterized protein (TIGR02569 family)